MFASTSLLHQRVQLQAARSPAGSRAHRRMTIVARGSGRFFIGGERGGRRRLRVRARLWAPPGARGGPPGSDLAGDGAGVASLAPRRAAAEGGPPHEPRERCSSPPSCAGNWKCNGTIDSVTQLVKDLNAGGRTGQQ